MAEKADTRAAVAWQETAKEPPPVSRLFWGWLGDDGIRKLRWLTPAQCAEEDGGSPDDYFGCFVDVDGDDCDPTFWCELDCIPTPSQDSNNE